MNAYEKMREALLALDAWVKVVKDNPKDKTAIECAEFVEVTAKTALAEPLRNCDVGTAEEQEKRFELFCYQDYCNEKCPLYGKPKIGGECGCAIEWAQMPYEEGGVKCPEAITQ